MCQCRSYNSQDKKEYLFYTEKHGSSDKAENWLYRRDTKTGDSEGVYASYPFLACELFLFCLFVCNSGG